MLVAVDARPALKSVSADSADARPEIGIESTTVAVDARPVSSATVAPLARGDDEDMPSALLLLLRAVTEELSPCTFKCAPNFLSQISISRLVLDSIMYLSMVLVGDVFSGVWGVRVRVSESASHTHTHTHTDT